MSFLISLFKPLAYISLPLLLVRQVAVSSMVGRYYARVVVYAGTLMTVASCSVFIAAGMSLIGQSTNVNAVVARIFYFLISRSLDLKISVEGEEHLQTSPTVLMANHQSMLDVLVIGRLMPKQTAIMSKKSLQFTPLGPFMTMSGTIFINRGNSASAVRSINAAGEKMKRNRTSVWMFPEGTRHMSETPDMLPLKKGGFHLAINAGIPITPIVTENYWHIYHKGLFESGTIKVRVLPPISTEGLNASDIGKFSTHVREVMLEALRDISPKVSAEKETLESQKPTTQDPKLAKSHGGPLESAAVSIIAVSEHTEDLVTKKSNSSSSIASSLTSSERRKANMSEAGTETEEDEGMILVGRPH
ncbi:1-acyl-sn-glycerol-3-phosphate acyltransferase [Psilocybe cubensis]|uniref:1-acyl-sn-glycerol-3-phosphate acyltransferase n=2 Tax=Psilocybe cubensis TaxID=181762 RepID=A0ACB8H2Y3_PSICU|nr:1-acyl-sn-glycerol-3-phosphate acyltransferase [Psilocybe cubensis]KAH9482335.1 1-acyl-sn-glycerol-3-phosphate acyltransferase [Psilocybe cubensis]